MSEAGLVTLTCPRCATQLQARAADAGKKVRCPHPECRLAVSVPFVLDDEDEPDEPVLLPEDPAEPQSVPVANATVRPRAKPTSAPRRKPRRDDERSAAKSRTAILPWALTAGACLLASVAVAGWAVTATRDTPADTSDRLAALESKNRELREENRNLREHLDKAKPVAPAPKEPDVPGPAPAPPWFNDPPQPFPGPKPHDEPKPPKPVDPPAKPARGRDAFVGKWSVESPELKKQGMEIDITVEFREDGTCRVEARVAGSVQDLTGKWRWEDRRLHVTMDQVPDAGKPAEVKWNGPDEFTMTGAPDNMPATFRRKAKP